ncbi:MAG TPA: hypothetical protein VF482_10645, partial [Trebonia sp.]
MRRDEQAAHGGQVVLAERAHGRGDPVVLGHHVPGPAEGLLVKDAGDPAKVIDADVAQRRHAEFPGGPLAGGTPGRVAAGRVRVPLAGVDQDQFQSRLAQPQRHDPRLLGAAVEEDGGARLAEQRRELVHDAGGRADDLVFRSLAGVHELRPAGA